MKFNVVLSQDHKPYTDAFFACAYLFVMPEWAGATFRKQLLTYYPDLGPIAKAGRKDATPKLEHFFATLYATHQVEFRDALQAMRHNLTEDGRRITAICDATVPSAKGKMSPVTIVLSAMPGPAVVSGQPTMHIPYMFSRKESLNCIVHELMHIYLNYYLQQAGLMSEFKDTPHQRLFVELMTDELLKRHKDPLAQSARADYTIFKQFRPQIDAKWKIWGRFDTRVQRIMALTSPREGADA